MRTLVLAALILCGCESVTPRASICDFPPGALNALTQAPPPRLHDLCIIVGATARLSDNAVQAECTSKNS